MEKIFSNLQKGITGFLAVEVEKNNQYKKSRCDI
jgi:hypothetical protein